MNQLALPLSRRADVREPGFPRASQKQLWALLEVLHHERLTFLDAVDRLGIAALSQRCGELRGLGWPVKDAWRRTVSGATIKEYWL